MAVSEAMEENGAGPAGAREPEKVSRPTGCDHSRTDVASAGIKI